MKRKVTQILFLIALSVALSICVSAQTADSNSPDSATNSKDLPEGLKENLAKLRIKSEEKDYQELIEQSEEAARLSSEIHNSLENNRNISADNLKKLDRLEKLVKKIRSELGAKNDDSADSLTEKEILPDEGKNLAELTSNLVSEIKKIGRYTISVVAIESSNSLLKLVKFLRFKSK